MKTLLTSKKIIILAVALVSVAVFAFFIYKNMGLRSKASASGEIRINLSQSIPNPIPKDQIFSVGITLSANNSNKISALDFVFDNPEDVLDFVPPDKSFPLENSGAAAFNETAQLGYTTRTDGTKQLNRLVMVAKQPQAQLKSAAIIQLRFKLRPTSSSTTATTFFTINTTRSMIVGPNIANNTFILGPIDVAIALVFSTACGSTNCASNQACYKDVCRTQCSSSYACVGDYDCVSGVCIPKSAYSCQAQTTDTSTYGLWHLDETSGNVIDSSGKGKTGEAHGSTSVDGKIGKARSFNGTSDYVFVPTTPLVNSTEMTLEFWMYPQRVGNGGDGGYSQAMFISADGTNGFSIEHRNNGSFELGTTVAGTYTPFTITNLNASMINQWHHVAVTIKANGPVTAYFDGQQVLNSKIGNWKSGSSNFVMGSGVITPFSQTEFLQYFKGVLDDVRLSNVVRSQSDILSDYQHGLACVSAYTCQAHTTDTSTYGLWHLDETSGNMIDSSGKGKTGEVHGTTSVDGKIGKARSFNGTSDYIAIPSLPAFGNAFTIDTWVNFDAANFNNFQEIFNNNQVFLRKDGSAEGNKIAIFVKLADTTVEPRASSTIIPVAGSWYHIAGTWDGTTLKLYVNSVLQGTSIRTGILNSTTVQAQIGMGEQTLLNQNPFSGTIDELRLSNVVRLQSDILSDYQHGIACGSGLGVAPTATPYPTAGPAKAQILFKVSIPDFSPSVNVLPNVRLQLRDGGNPIEEKVISLQRDQGSGFFKTTSAVSFNIEAKKEYTLLIKQLKTVRRSFKVTLENGKTTDCIADPPMGECGSLGNSKLAPLWAGDTDGFNDGANGAPRSDSYNKIDAADLQKMIAGYKASSLPPEPNADFNLDGKIDVFDLGILGKNFGKIGE